MPRKRAFFSSIIKYCILYGKAYRTENFEAIACRKLPGDIKFGFWRMFRSGMLKLYKVLGKERFNHLMEISKTMESSSKKHMGNQKYLYFLFLYH